MAAAPSVKLLESVKRAQGNAAVPVGPYDEESVRAVTAESKSMYEDILELMKEENSEGEDLDDLPDGVKATLVVRHQAILRNKQCSHFYLQHRLETLCRLRMEAGLALPDDVRNNMSQLEASFFSDYDEILSEYMRELRLDLTAHLRPPKHLFVEVRANVDCGDLVTEYSGVLNLAKGTSHYLRLSDVQHLINQGMLQHVG